MVSDADFPLDEREFRAIYTRVPRLTVELIMRDRGGLVLTRRDIEPCKGQWHLPGGTVWFGESLHDAVRRVARRELGVVVAVGRLLGYIEYPAMHAAGYYGWPVGVAFETVRTGGRLRGTAEGEVIGHFSTVPDNTIVEQARFIERHVLVGRTLGTVSHG